MTDDDLAIVEVVDAFARRELAERAEQLRDDEPLPVEVLDGLAAAGLWAIGMPETIGGQGADRRTLLLTLSRLGRVAPAAAVAVLHAHCAVSALVAADEPTPAEDIAGGRRGVVAFRAEVSPGRLPVLRLDAGLHPEWIVLIAAGSGDSVITAPYGVHTGARHVRSGLAGLGTSSADITVDRIAARVGAEAVRLWLLGTAAIAVGAASGAADIAADYTGNRHQFGGPIGDIPAVAARLAALNGAVRTAVSELDRLESSADDDPDGLLRQTNALCTTALNICLDSIQLLGGYGYLAEYGVERLARDCISLRAANAIGRYLPSIT